jgi:hypothetical protein
MGGGVYQATLNNCALTGNSAANGGGAAFGVLNNCTLTANSASTSGGGAYQTTLNNSIVYFNTGPSGANFSGATMNYCCTSPLPLAGAGNLSSDPQLASATHLSASSPCRAAGSIGFAGGSDIDSETWTNPPSIGCDEYWPGHVTGSLAVAISADYTNVAAGYPVNFTGIIAGRISASMWDFADGGGLSNRPFASHTWPNAGDYPVILTAFNDDYPAGVTATVTVHVATQTIFYVAVDGTNPAAPYSNWATAASDIQSALDVALLPGQSVLVSNGVYQIGGKLHTGSTTTNRVAVERAMRVASVNGPAVTTILGQRATSGGGIGPGAVRCVYLASGAVLDGFTLSTGATGNNDLGGGVYCQTAAAVVTNCVFFINYAYYGAGVYSGTLNNCTLQSNAAYGYAGGAYASTLNNCILYDNGANFDGGGAYSATLNNCFVTSNRAINYGGGTRSCTLNNCIVRHNNAEWGGGVYLGTLNNCTVFDNYAYAFAGGMYQSTLRNCIVYYNGSPSSPNSLGGTLTYCCTTPAAPGAGNITNAPLFVDQSSANLHLQNTSPCINSGRNTYAPTGLDLDGNPRIAGGTVDIGPYEIQSPASLLSYAWAQQYGLPADGSVDTADTDGDGMNNWQEWIAGTDPTNPGSVLRLQPPVVSPSGSVTLTWSSVTNRTYSLESAINFMPLFSVINSNITGQAGVTSVTNTGPVASPSGFYRVRVEL